MGRRLTILLTVLMLLGAAQAAWSFEANTAAIGFVDGPAPGSPAGTYTSMWTVQAVPFDGTYGWDPAWVMVELEFQPDGTPTSYSSLKSPSAAWEPPDNPEDGWIGWYLNKADYGTEGLAPSEVGQLWTMQYSVPNAINAQNYHIKFATWNASAEKWTVNQLSKTAGENGEVPEPASLVLLAMGVTGTVGMIRRKRAR